MKIIMEPEPYTLVFLVPVLIGLGLLCFVRRHRKNFEKEKETIIREKKKQGEIIAKFNDIK